MSGVDYLAFHRSYRDSLMHSPKGTTWKKHKYVKKVNGRYIYDVDSAERDVRKDMDEVDRRIERGRNWDKYRTNVENEKLYDIETKQRQLDANAPIIERYQMDYAFGRPIHLALAAATDAMEEAVRKRGNEKLEISKFNKVKDKGLKLINDIISKISKKIKK